MNDTTSGRGGVGVGTRSKPRASPTYYAARHVGLGSFATEPSHVGLHPMPAIPWKRTQIQSIGVCSEAPIPEIGPDLLDHLIGAAE
jgi:hypothetical protein